jgi:polyadenylate-binding protein
MGPRWNNIGGAAANFNSMQIQPYMMQAGQGAYGQMSRPGGVGGGPRMGGGPAAGGGGMRQPYGYQATNQYQGGGGMPGGRFAQQQQPGRMPPMMGQAQMGGMRGQPISNYQMVGANSGPMVYQTYANMNQQQQQQRGGMMPQNQMQMQNNQQSAGIVIQNQEPLTPQMLASAQPQEQKQLLGERLYPLIQRMSKPDDDVGKITGMMLEMDNAELLMMLENEELLQTKVNEAISVLSQNKPIST